MGMLKIWEANNYFRDTYDQSLSKTKYYLKLNRPRSMMRSSVMSNWLWRTSRNFGRSSFVFVVCLNRFIRLSTSNLLTSKQNKYNIMWWNRLPFSRHHYEQHTSAARPSGTTELDLLVCSQKITALSSSLHNLEHSAEFHKEMFSFIWTIYIVLKYPSVFPLYKPQRYYHDT